MQDKERPHLLQCLYTECSSLFALFIHSFIISNCFIQIRVTAVEITDLFWKIFWKILRVGANKNNNCGSRWVSDLKLVKHTHLHARRHARTCTHAHTCTHTYTCTHAHIHTLICTHTHMHTYAHTHMHTHTYTRTHMNTSLSLPLSEKWLQI